MIIIISVFCHHRKKKLKRNRILVKNLKLEMRISKVAVHLINNVLFFEYKMNPKYI